MATPTSPDPEWIKTRADSLTRALQATADSATVEEAAKLLKDLRQLREFGRLCRLAEMVSRYRPGESAVMGQYAQGLIECGQLTSAVALLNDALRIPNLTDEVAAELEGLQGRAYKQLFVETVGANEPLAANCLRASIAAYRRGFERAPASNYWHAINLSAVSHAAAQRGITPVDARPSADYASLVLKALEAVQTQPLDLRDAWWYATKAEAHIARGEWTAAEEALGTYIRDPRTQPFNLGSTLRQLRDIWVIQNVKPIGAQLLQMLEANLAHRDGGVLEMRFEHLVATRSVEPAAGNSLQRVIGADAFKTLPWYIEGLDRARAVGAVCERLGVRFGTGFAVASSDFGIDPSHEVLFLTNFHVLNSSGLRGRKDLGNVEILFEAVGDKPLRFGVSSIVSESNAETGLDYALLRLKDRTDELRPVALASQIGAADSDTQVYIIGYPLGNVMQFSLQDNRLIDHECGAESDPPDPKRRRVQYTAPTQPGSSGSPVFDQYWECVALHHAGGKVDPQHGDYGIPALNGKNTYVEANEGIWIGSIQDDVRAKHIKLQ